MSEDTIAATATPQGKGALGIVRLSGTKSLSIAASFIKPQSQKWEPRKILLASAFLKGEFLDQVTVVYFPSLASPTGEDLVEITAHGSPLILNGLLKSALQFGARLADPGEFSRRAFLNGKMDLSQAEAVCDLIQAESSQAHRLAILQLNGGISRVIKDFRAKVFEALVGVEASLDHPEDEIPLSAQDEFLADIEREREKIAAFAWTYEQGKKLSQGQRICIAGLPNAGKSSLLNALLGRDRAIVNEIPGTTRDTLEEDFEIGGIASILIDTAGIRPQAENSIEEEGIWRAQEALKNSDLALLVIDRSRPMSTEDEALNQRILKTAQELGRSVIPILNKSDLPSLNKNWQGIEVSALRKEGMQKLKETILQRLNRSQPQDGVLITRLRHHQALLKAAQELSLVEEAVLKNPGRWEERAAFHLRESSRLLGDITGENAEDEVLNAIFSKFCVGK